MGDINVNGDGNIINIGGKNVKQKSKVVKPNNSEQSKKTPFYKEWWFVSLMLGILSGIGSYIGLGNIWLSLSIAIVAFLITIFFDPKKRFFRVGLILLSLGGSTILPIVNKLIGKYLGINLDPNPWLGGLMVIVAFGLFVLDHIENKNN